MIDKIEGITLEESVESEPWEYSTSLTKKEITGWLRDAVLSRLGRNEGVVTSLEDSSSYGTCEICGSYTEGITLYVDGVEVYTGFEDGAMDTEDYPNPFTKLEAWLNE